MKQSIQISRFGGPEVLKIIEEKSSQSLPRDSVRIRVKAAGVNFADLMMRMGLYPEAPPLPFIPGYEIAGTVVECGSDVRQFSPGERVLAGTRFGGYTSEIVLPAKQIRKTPDHLSDVEGASITVNFLTAWSALHEMARVRKGDTVLIQSAGGGVGLAASQICREVGANTVGLVSSPIKKEILRQYGFSEAFTYEEWQKDAQNQMGRFQIILDSHGGKSIKQNFKSLAPLGRLVSFGASTIVGGQKRSLAKMISFAIQTPFFTPFKLMMENKGVFGFNLLSLFDDLEKGKPSVLLQALDSILERFKDQTFKPSTVTCFQLKDAQDAHKALIDRSHSGKIILTI